VENIMRSIAFKSAFKAAALSVLAAPVLLGGLAPTAATADEIAVTIERVRGVGQADALSKSDFYARVTIAGQTFQTDLVRNQNDARPNWVIKKDVPSGVHDVKVEILDKDLTKSETIDITRTAGKRDLDFKVRTRRCNISGFSPSPACGQPIVRAGNEGKAAEITFSVNTKR
jgi:hypothetical protein